MPSHTRTERRLPPQRRIEAAGHEVKANPPAILAKTRRKKGKKAAKRQRRAIVLNKARRAASQAASTRGSLPFETRELGRGFRAQRGPTMVSQMLKLR